MILNDKILLKANNGYCMRNVLHSNSNYKFGTLTYAIT